MSLCSVKISPKMIENKSDNEYNLDDSNLSGTAFFLFKNISRRGLAKAVMQKNCSLSMIDQDSKRSAYHVDLVMIMSFQI